MLIIPLAPHPGDAPIQDLSVTAQISVTAAGLVALSFAVEGAVEAVLWPPPAPPRRVDGLWRTTCLEAFFTKPGQSDYLEINLSPSGAWAGYAFSGYRHGMRDAGLAAPIITTTSGAGRLQLSATLPMRARAPFTHVAPNAVIETTDGGKSYFAPAHGKETPDFHTLAGMAPLPDPTEPA